MGFTGPSPCDVDLVFEARKFLVNKGFPKIYACFLFPSCLIFLLNSSLMEVPNQS